MELRSIKQYNPEYHKDGTLIWKLIGEKIGKHARKKKHYPRIDINKIVIQNDIEVDDEILGRSRELYTQTREMIPVYLSFDFRLIGGYEQYALAKELGLKKIPMQRVTTMNSGEKKEFRKAICHQPLGNKKYGIKTEDGGKLFISLNQYKKFKELLYLADCFGCKLTVRPDFSLCAKNQNGEYLFNSDEKCLSMKEMRENLRRQLKGVI